MALFESALDDAKYAFKSGKMVTKLMLLNGVVFVFMMVAWLGIRLVHSDPTMAKETFNWFYRLFCTPSNLGELIRQPWSPITSMFLHVDFWGHLIGNLMFLALFGRVVSDLIGDRRVLPIYLLGALLGDVFYLLQTNLLDPNAFYYSLGASAGVMALAGAALLIAPDHEYYFLLLGRIKLQYVVGVLVLLDFVSIASDINKGGHFAHLGGFAFGLFFVMRLREGRDMAEPINNALDWIKQKFDWKGRTKRTPRKPGHKAVRVSIGGTERKPNHVSDGEDLSFQEKLDTILDKIKSQGYEGLTAEEKDFLYQASKR